MRCKLVCLLSFIMITATISLPAQQKKHTAVLQRHQPAPPEKTSTLFQVNVATAFIGGLYDASYPYRALKQHGDFGLGAPDKLDGEIVMFQGKLYQTQSSGHTFEPADTGRTSLAFANFFHADKVIKLPHAMDRKTLYHYLDSLLDNHNGIYAIHIHGNFSSLKTRAFPPPPQPYQPLASMLDQQHFFNFNNITGDLIGYLIPLYMEALSIHGYHFHFLSEKKDAGGHMIDFTLQDGSIEINMLQHYALTLPGNEEFKNFDFGKDRKEELRSVENGKK